jgi:hypothetical protein
MHKACVTRAVTAASTVHDGSSVAEWALFLHDENDSSTGGPPDNGDGTGAYRRRGGDGDTVKLGGSGFDSGVVDGKLQHRRGQEAMGSGGASCVARSEEKRSARGRKRATAVLNAF